MTVRGIFYTSPLANNEFDFHDGEGVRALGRVVNRFQTMWNSIVILQLLFHLLCIYVVTLLSQLTIEFF